MDQNNLDNYIKTTLINHQTPIDSDALWSSIESSKKRANGIKLLALLIILVLVGSMSIYMLSEHNINPDQKMVAIVSDQESDNQGSQTQLLGSEFNDEKSDYNSESKPSASTSVVNSEDYKTTNQNFKTLEKKLNYKETTNQTKSYTTFTKSKSEVKNINQVSHEDAADIINVESDIKQSESGEVNNTDVMNSISPEFNSLNPLESITPTLETSTEDFTSVMSTTECPTFGNKKKTILAEVYTTLDYILQNYSASSPDSENYLEERKATQSYRPSYTLGAQLKYLFDNGLFIKAGLEYSNARERFRYRQETITTEILPNQIIGIHIDQFTGDSTIILGNAPVTTIEPTNWRVKNSYRSMGVPIFVGYQMTNGPWFYSAEIGIVYNFKFDFNGFLLDENLTPTKVDNYFVSKTNINYGLGLTAGYALNDYLSLLVKAHGRIQSTDINTANNLVTQRFNTIGMGVGLEYKF